MSGEKYYPTDPIGQTDAGARVPKPGELIALPLCCARIDRPGANPAISWCALLVGHDGEHLAPAARELPRNDFMPRPK